MKVFISHSMKNPQLLQALHHIAASQGIHPLIAEHSVDVKNTITVKIQQMIQGSDLVLVILTQEGFNSNFVQQEIGYAVDKKPMLIVVERGFETKIAGFIYGRDPVILDPWNPQPAYARIQQVLAEQKQKKEQQESIGKLILAGLGIFFFVALTSK